MYVFNRAKSRFLGYELDGPGTVPGIVKMTGAALIIKQLG